MKQVAGAAWMAMLAGVALALVAGCQKPAPEPEVASETQTEASPEGSSEAGNESTETDPVELEFWRSVKDSEHTDDLWAYLERYPQGAFADLAKSRIERLAKGEAAPAPAPPTQSAPVASAPKSSETAPPARRRSREQIVRDVIRRELSRFSDPRLHIAPDIPRRKLDNAASVHGFNSSDVLLLWDDGFSGGGKTGFCLTDRKVYWRFVSGSPAYFLDFEDVDQVRVRKNKFLLNGYDVGVTMAGNPPRAAEAFAELLEAIRDELRRR